MPLAPPPPPTVPLKALRAFEAAARLGSFVKAAEELRVTPGAVAQQIRKLEDWAGATLFQRHAQGVSLTPQGAEALPELTRTFANLGAVAQRLRRRGRPQALQIAALPAIAQLWLGPRLAALKKSIAGLTLSVTALETIPDLGRGEYDLALFPVPEGRHPSYDVTVLHNTELFPVAAPGLAASLSSPAQLAAVPLLHDSTWRDHWERWLALAGVEGVDHRSGAEHSLYSLAVEQALAGEGVLIGHSALLETHLAEGRLVALFDGCRLADDPLCLLTARGRAGDRLVSAVVDSLAS